MSRTFRRRPASRDCNISVSHRSPARIFRGAWRASATAIGRGRAIRHDRSASRGSLPAITMTAGMSRQAACLCVLPRARRQGSAASSRGANGSTRSAAPFPPRRLGSWPNVLLDRDGASWRQRGNSCAAIRLPSKAGRSSNILGEAGGVDLTISASRPFGRERHPPSRPARFGWHTGRGWECRAPHAARMVMTCAISPSPLPKPTTHLGPEYGANRPAPGGTRRSMAPATATC